ncbi:periplasmic heavy metal sensor [Rhodobacterales bacterium HKCCA1058]|nr:periplasmic heavy metal sensor [Rhodobacterales bacterium HKCCA1058]
MNRDEMRMLIGRMGAREGMGAARRGIGAANLQVEAALRATPFVPDALMQALSEQRGYRGAIQESGHRALVDLIADMPPERRAALADELAEGRRR